MVFLFHTEQYVQCETQRAPQAHWAFLISDLSTYKGRKRFGEITSNECPIEPLRWKGKDIWPRNSSVPCADDCGKHARPENKFEPHISVPFSNTAEVASMYPAVIVDADPISA